jgi:hypothetical protein
MNADEDPDWVAEAEAAEAEQNWAEFWESAAASQQKILKSKPLEVKTRKRGERLVVTFFEEHGDPLATGPIEFTILDPASCKVIVKDERNFTEPTEGILLGSEHFNATPYNRVFQEGKLAQFWWLNYEAGGKEFDRDRFPHTIKGIEIILPSGNKFDIWND